MIMARYDSWTKLIISLAVITVFFETANSTTRNNATLTACQHLRRAESRRAKALDTIDIPVRIPRCSRRDGNFEPIQCSNELSGTQCWCVDEYGLEVPGTRGDNEAEVNCTATPENECSASSCRMFCPAGFARDSTNGCPICKCRDPCDGVKCPRGQSCEAQEVQCVSEPCPPVPTCRKARSFTELCPAGQPLSITGTVRPFLCGNDPGKPACPPLYRCLVQSGNDYGVCCPASLQYQKPGTCPNPENVESTYNTGVLCGTPCGHDLECPQLQKCCQTNGCGTNCQHPTNVTICHQAKMLSEILSVNEREGRGYIPQCEGPGGSFSSRQCSRNGLVCWCVDSLSGNKLKGTMGAADSVNCEAVANVIARSRGRSADASTTCDQNICAAVCEYGFKNDHNGCPTCECSEPCEGFKCPMSSHCEVARDPQCSSDSGLCASEPICKPDLVYSNPCEIGTPLAHNITGEIMFCNEQYDDEETVKPKNNEYQGRSFFDDEPTNEEKGRAFTNSIQCPVDYKCTKLPKENGNVCCPEPQASENVEDENSGARQQSMCEYLRDFSDRMEGTEDGMSLALAPPKCNLDGSYEAMQCTLKKVKVSKTEQKKILEQNNIRRMRQMLSFATRTKRSANAGSGNLKLFKVDPENIVDYLKQRVLATPQVDFPIVQARSAKLIDAETSGSQNYEDVTKPIIKPIKKDDDLIEMEVEECWCVDGFGTEIPKSRGDNATHESCERLRETLECLDLTCRMGCDYGFVLDNDTQCPACECRDPCDSVTCAENEECRSVEVSCDGEYCPPVPACFPRKPGQCPFLVPPGNDDPAYNDSCDYECRSDSHCEGIKRCCSNGCGTQCVEPQLKTACQHLQTIQLHQAIDLGVPAKQKYIAQCNEKDGSWKTVQCGPGSVCWCVDELGNEKTGTKTYNGEPNCEVKTKVECPLMKCKPCQHGYEVNENGCRTCECRDPCNEISCPVGERCDLVQVECIDVPCPKMPICIPIRDNLCPEGSPLKLNGKELGCGPQNEADLCPTTHTCQLNPMSNRGVCCAKTRDVCFESIDAACLTIEENINDIENIVKWRFSPRQNKCVPVTLQKTVTSLCQAKNLFHSESACMAVCPVLSQCERLRVKNTMAAKRAGQSNTWFQPRCDPETGNWSPVQCLGQSKNQTDNRSTERSSSSPIGVCWCADKKGAPVKGSLTKGNEPTCNHRQARRRMHTEETNDPVMEELIRQITYLVDENNFLENENERTIEKNEKLLNTPPTVTEKILNITPAERFDQKRSSKVLVATTTRCSALRKAASFLVACDDAGGFMPTQCNGDVCWCVDAAGNQLPLSSTFKKDSKSCQFTAIDSVEIELHLTNPDKVKLHNLYDVLKEELMDLLGTTFDNFRVHENFDGSATLKIDLIDIDNVDTAFAIEEMVRDQNLLLFHGDLIPDITQSRFLHRTLTNLPIPQKASGIPESTFQTIVFIISTSSAFLISIFVVFIMLKRGKNKMKNYDNNKSLGDKFLDYSSPIFVLSPDKDKPHNSN